MIIDGGNYILEEFAAVRRQIATFKLCLFKKRGKVQVSYSEVLYTTVLFCYS